ncbi:MAG: Tol-Pal system beta propeller repeat protein TolB [Desulfuromonadales bacterium]|nr:Tol-Pal system beta propeller repeat protein TolB [Desulfuromonadales bacterium]
MFRQTVGWLLILFCLGSSAWAAQIEISAPGEQTIPLALTRFIAENDSDQNDAAEQLYQALENDLDLSGLFRFISPQAFLDDAAKPGLYSTQVNFAQWRLLGADTLVKGTYRLQNDQLIVEARLFDVVNRRLLTGRRYVGRSQDARRIGHAFADQIMRALTGEDGPFSSRLAFISDRTGHSELWLMDVDGHNPIQLTNHRSIVLNPDFSPQGKEILFTSYYDNNPDLYRKEIYTGQEARVSFKDGLNIAGRYAPNGRDIALTLSRDQNPEIYVIDRTGRIRSRVTDSWGIDSDPSWSPDGRQITFVSSRAGNPHLFIADLESGTARRLTVNGKYNATPDWNPKQDLIAFTRMENGRFDVYTIRTDGSDERRLTFGPGNQEHPRWSPDGRFLTYSSDRDGKRAIFVMRADGTGARRLTAPTSTSRHPAWSGRW